MKISVNANMWVPKGIPGRPEGFPGSLLDVLALVAREDRSGNEVVWEWGSDPEDNDGVQGFRHTGVVVIDDGEPDYRREKCQLQ